MTDLVARLYAETERVLDELETLDPSTEKYSTTVDNLEQVLFTVRRMDGFSESQKDREDTSSGAPKDPGGPPPAAVSGDAAPTYDRTFVRAMLGTAKREFGVVVADLIHKYAPTLTEVPDADLGKLMEDLGKKVRLDDVRARLDISQIR